MTSELLAIAKVCCILVPAAVVISAGVMKRGDRITLRKALGSLGICIGFFMLLPLIAMTIEAYNILFWIWLMLFGLLLCRLYSRCKDRREAVSAALGAAFGVTALSAFFGMCELSDIGYALEDSDFYARHFECVDLHFRTVCVMISSFAVGAVAVIPAFMAYRTSAKANPVLSSVLHMAAVLGSFIFILM